MSDSNPDDTPEYSQNDKDEERLEKFVSSDPENDISDIDDNIDDEDAEVIGVWLDDEDAANDIDPGQKGQHVILDAILTLQHDIHSLHKEFQTKIKNDTHKEALIDRLHNELQEHKKEVFKNQFKAIILDVISLMDKTRKLLEHYREQTLSESDAEKLFSLMESIPVDMDDLLMGHNITPFVSDKNSAYDPKHQKIVKTQPTSDIDKDKTIFKSLRAGYEWNGKIIRPEMVLVYRYKESNTTNEMREINES